MLPRKYRGLLNKALWGESWLEYWRVRHVVSSRKVPYIIHCMAAPLFNWRCLFVPVFYRKAARQARKTVSKSLCIFAQHLGLSL